jgi:hypothetical protein
MSNPHNSALFVGHNHGSANLHTGTAPGTAHSASTSGGASLAPGPFQMGSTNPARVVNQTVGKLTNHSVPVMSVVKRFKAGHEKFIQKGQFVFLQCKMSPTFERSRMDATFNLPMMNYYLALLSNHWFNNKEFEDPREIDSGSNWRLMTAERIASEYVPHGVVIHANGESASGSSRRAGTETMINVTVRGEADTFNVWGGGLRDGDDLYFIYKQVLKGRGSAEAAFSYSLDFQGSRTTPTIHENLKYVWQIVPHVHRCTDSRSLLDHTLPLENGKLVYPESSSDQPQANQAQYGYARYVGRVQHARRLGGTPIREDESKRYLHLMVNRTQHTIFIDL